MKDQMVIYTYYITTRIFIV